MPDTLYEQDFYRWTQEQAAALRARAEQGANLPLDWANVAEEIESLGRSDRREIVSRLRTIAEHLLKLEHSPTHDPGSGWRDTVRRERLTVEGLIAESPSLRPDLPSMAASAVAGAVRLTARGLADHGEAGAARRIEAVGAPYTPDQLLGDWFPPEPDDL